MGKQPASSTTASELAFLQILWTASRPLNKQEILEKAGGDHPMFAKNSFHLLANELIAKGYLVAIDNGGIGRKNARRYAPTVSRNEYLALQIHSAKGYSALDIPDILSALLKLSSGANLEPVLAGIEQVIAKRQREKDAESPAYDQP